jgi:hypothetical protein
MIATSRSSLRARETGEAISKTMLGIASSVLLRKTILAKTEGLIC